ncbi:MAG TPA: histidine phosphatase family protein [Pyrinomonadaceae bacterium]|jgi:broad specificity phosphatase PhoE
MNFPETIWLIRHGESTANIARQKAERENSLTIDYLEREMDIPLSETGVAHSITAGRWFGGQSEKPTVIFASPYLRTFETARFIKEAAGLENVEIFHDERIREREFGIFDRLTWRGSVEKYPEECAKRESIGKFYYRPPGGESWCDVALRVRNFWRDLCLHHAGEKILIVTHEVVIRVFRYVVERLTEAEILAIDKSCDIINGAVSEYRFDGEKKRFVLELDNYVPEGYFAGE